MQHGAKDKPNHAVKQPTNSEAITEKQIELFPRNKNNQIQNMQKYIYQK